MFVTISLFHIQIYRETYTFIFILFIYYKVFYIKYRNLPKQCTAQKTWKVQKAQTVQLGAANRRN